MRWPPVSAAEERDEGGNEEGADDVCVEQDAGGEVWVHRKLESTTVAGDLPTYAPVTPTALMAEVCREHAWFAEVRRSLGKLDDRLDQFLPSSRAWSLWSAPAISTTRVSPAATAATARLCSGGTIESREPYTTVVGTFTLARWSASG
jgi:hypothetical protein